MDLIGEILLVIGTLLLGAILKGATGMGLPLVATPVISVLLGVPHAIAVITIPVILSNAWQSWNGRALWPELRFLKWFLVIGIAGVAVGTWLLAAIPSHWLELMLGLIVTIYLALYFTAPNLKLGAELAARLAPPAGFFTGIFHASVGISSPVSGTYLHAMKLRRELFVAGISTSFLVFSGLQLPMLFYANIMTGDRLIQGCLGLIAVVIGLPIGAWMGKRMSQQAFDRLTLGILVATGAPLLWKGLAGILG